MYGAYRRRSGAEPMTFPGGNGSTMSHRQGNTLRAGFMSEDRPMRVLVLLVPLLVAGCFSFSSSSPTPPASNTVVLPPGASVVCSDGTRPPCR
jgi:hypothetical protein